MFLFRDFTEAQQNIIRQAYEFERDAIASQDLDIMVLTNPYLLDIYKWQDGDQIAEAISVALELYFL